MSRTKASSFGVIAHMRGLPDKAAKLRVRLHDLTGLTRKEDGCISCEIVENECDATEFTLLAEWSDEAAHNAHFSASLIQSALLPLLNLLSTECDHRKSVLRLNTIKYGTNSYGLAAS